MGKKKPTDPKWRYASTFNLSWVDKDGHMFLIGDEQDLEIGTKEMLRTACPLTVIVSPA